MNEYYKKAKQNRSFINPQTQIEKWTDIEPYFKQLQEASVDTVSSLEKWLVQHSELEAVLEEELAWRYINMSCYTENEAYANQFNTYVTEIEPKVHKAFHQLDEKIYNSPALNKLNQEKYFIFTRGLKNRMEIFREENIAIFSALQVEEQKYGAINGGMTILHDNKELTLQQAQNLLKNPDRRLRKEVFDKIVNRREKDYTNLDKVLDSLIGKRHQVSVNAGFENYRDYKFREMGRFDYSVDDVMNFHEAIENNVVPALKSLHAERKKKLGLQSLKPWDLDVDTEGKPPLQPFDKSSDLISRTINCFDEIDPFFGNVIRDMNQNGYLDLESRKGKAPGGFNYPLYESNLPFIFMNATQNQRDLETMVHEGGHAIHSVLSRNLGLVAFKNLPSEVAELASMSMELISMEHWHHFYPDEENLRRAKISQLEGIVAVLPWVATIDAFQHWLYLHPNHTSNERNAAWTEISSRFGSGMVDWDGYESHFNYQWQKQLHIYQVPFYYIEYGIAQLGALAVWKNYIESPNKAIADYKNALQLGYSKTIPEIYKQAGIEFNFKDSYIKSLMKFLVDQLNGLKY